MGDGWVDVGSRSFYSTIGSKRTVKRVSLSEQIQIETQNLVELVNL